jgi:molybdenum cofactor cytidylyltransferase
MPDDRTPPPVAGIVLAAGLSTRMGRNKMLIEMAGEPLVRRAARVAVDAGLSPVVVVIGHEADRARAAIGDLECRPVVNADYREGVRTSVRAGVLALPGSAPAAVVMLADMPLVTSGMLSVLVERYRVAAAPLVVSRYGEVNAPPTLYDRRLFPELTALEGPGCGKRVVERHRDEAVVVDWAIEVLDDLDEPGDVERLAAHSSRGGGPHAP